MNEYKEIIEEYFETLLRDCQESDECESVILSLLTTDPKEYGKEITKDLLSFIKNKEIE